LLLVVVCLLLFVGCCLFVCCCCLLLFIVFISFVDDVVILLPSSSFGDVLTPSFFFLFYQPTSSSNSSSSTSSSSPPPPPHHHQVVIHELARETLGVHTCDRRRGKSELLSLFPFTSAFQWNLVGDGEKDELWKKDHRESDDEERDRAASFLRWLANRPEQKVAVVSHGGFITACLQVLKFYVIKVLHGTALRLPLVRVNSDTLEFKDEGMPLPIKQGGWD